jgi:hypothetical protein
MQATALNPIFCIDPADRTYLIGRQVDLDVTASAGVNAGSTVYTAKDYRNPLGAASYYAGVEFSVFGFLNTPNNGLFPCTASAATTVTLTNTGGVAETPTGGAHMTGWMPLPIPDQAPLIGRTWAVPGSVLSGRKSGFTWQTSYINSPSGVSVAIQGSHDNVNWTTIDTTTNTSGEARYVASNPFGFLRVYVTTLTGTGAGVLVSIVYGAI